MSSRWLNARRLSNRVSGSCSARKRISSNRAAEFSAAVAWFANTLRVWSIGRSGSSRSTGSSAQITPLRLPFRSHNGTNSQCPSHAHGPTPFCTERYAEVPAGQPCERLPVFEHVTALDLERRVEQRRARTSDRWSRAASSATSQPSLAWGWNSPGVRIGQIECDLPETERLRYPAADRTRAPHLPTASRSSCDDTCINCPRAACWRSAAAWSCVASTAIAACSATATSTWSAASSGRWPETGSPTEMIPRKWPSRVHHRREQLIAGPPGAGRRSARDVAAARLVVPVELAVGDQVGPQRSNRGPAAAPSPPTAAARQQHLARGVIADDRGHLEVVPCGPVGVHHHDAVAERLRTVRAIASSRRDRSGSSRISRVASSSPRKRVMGVESFCAMGEIGPSASGGPGNRGVFYVFRRMRASIERFRTVLGAAAAVLVAAFACAGCAKSAESPVAMPGRAVEVTVAPDSYGTLWMTTTARAYRSQDGGNSWRPVSGSAGGGSVAFSVKHAYLFGPRGARVGSFAGPFVRRAPEPPRMFVAVTSPYYRTHRLYALDQTGGIWMSPNSGTAWSQLRAAGLPSQGVALAARRQSYDQPDVIYVADGAAGLWKSTNFGATFRRVKGLELGRRCCRHLRRCTPRAGVRSGGAAALDQRRLDVQTGVARPRNHGGRA